jgi:uncharacterized glyoxalase superfamily protein PhnB
MFPKMSKCTSVLVVNEVEPCVEFWVNRLGFTMTAEVPHEDGIGFAMLTKDGVELMYQSLASAQMDLNETVLSKSALYLDVDDIDLTISQLDGVEVVVPKRVTSYGATEYWVREPGGNMVGFAQLKSA